MKDRKYLIVQEPTRKGGYSTSYSGEGNISSWRQKLGKEPDKDDYKLTQITVTSKNLSDENYEAGKYTLQIRSVPVFHDKVQRSEEVNHSFCLDEKSIGLIEKIIEDLKPEAGR